MLKFLARDSITFDTETIPDVEAARRLVGPTWMGTDDDVRHELFCRADADYERDWWKAKDEGAAPPRPPFLKPILQQVVSIAVVRRQVAPDGVKIKLTVLERPIGSSLAADMSDEAWMVSRFLKVLGDNNAQLVGFNSEGFDLPLLVQRALVHGIAVPSFCKRPDKPWEGRDLHARYSDWHVDLMHELGGFGRSVPSLSEACAALNILGGAKDVTGADVLDLHLAGDLTAIRQYNAKDAVRHFLILLRLCVLAGHVTPEQAAREEADVCAQLDAYCAAPVGANT